MVIRNVSDLLLPNIDVLFQYYTSERHYFQVDAEINKLANCRILQVKEIKRLSCFQQPNKYW